MSGEEDFIEFEIPDVSTLGRYTISALRDLQLEASATFDALRESLSPDTVDDNDLSDLDALKTFMKAVDKEVGARKRRQSAFNALTADDEEDQEDSGADEEAEGEPPMEPKAKAKAKAKMKASEYSAETETAEEPKVDAKVPSVAQVAAVTPTPVTFAQIAANAGKAEVTPQFTILAAADTGYSAGAKLDGWLDVAKAFVARSHTHSGGTAQQSTVASIRREFTNEMSISDGDDDISAMGKLDALRNEANLPGGSLLAGAGWCAPSETIYTTCNQITADGLLNLPEVGARRGGIRHNKGIEFDTIFGDGTGFNILTESQVISDTTKTCVKIPCPSFSDDRLKVSALCLTGDILQNRGYPEFVSEFIQGAIAAQAHNVNRQIVADIISDSVAVSLNGAPWASDNTVLSQVMSAVDMAVVDIQYRLRLQRNQTVEVIFPYWMKAQLRADWIRRNGPLDPNLTDGMIDALLATRNVRAQWIYDWQDAFTSTGVSGGGQPGSDNAMVEMPLSAQFIAYPSGTWVVARQDVIRLDTIYDSTNLATNKVTQLFLEDGFRAMRFCPISRVYTVAVCPSGATGNQRSVTC